MFCSECGLEINDTSIRFCPECGTKVDILEQQEIINGVIFTNISLLSARLKTSESNVVDIIQTFIERKRRFGVDYRLVDVGNYTFHKKNFLGIARTTRLKRDSSLNDYMDILTDVHHAAMEVDATERMLYLFIIGGSDVIPMPKVKHFLPEGTDVDIDTDMLWAYPYGAKMVEELENQNLFKYIPTYHVGRLPIAEDGKVEDLSSYLERDLDCSSGIPMNMAYGQCDPNWKRVSGAVSSSLAVEGYLPDLGHRLSSDCYSEGLILSPNIISQYVNKVLNTGASMYYFNLHGGEGYELRGYFGETLEKDNCYCVIEPEHLAQCTTSNIVFSEACYGGRFIGLDKKHSMMLSAISTETLAFVGSSRIAWGAIDACQDYTSNVVSLGYADVLANQFINNVLQGENVAEAFFEARSCLLKSCSDVIAAASVVEFNLYGDPTLKMDVGIGADVYKKSLVPAEAKVGCSIKTVVKKNKSILDQVREAVDLNIREIHSKVDEYLYSYYGIEPRPVSNIFKVQYANGNQELIFDYKTNNKVITGQLIVSAGLDGKVRKVCASK